MKRQATVLLTVTWLVLGIVLTPGNRGWAAPDAATLKSVTLTATRTGTELVLRVDGDYTYKTVQASPEALFIDLAGAQAGDVTRTERWSSPVFAGYKVLAYKDASGQPIVRVQVDTKQASPFVVQKDGSRLRVILDKSLPTSAAAAPAPSSATALAAPRASVAAPATASGLLIVSNVNFDKRESGETLVDVTTSRSPVFHVTTLPDPARLVVDIEDAKDTAKVTKISTDTTVLKAIRMRQFRAGDPSVVRVVADLDGDPAFDVHATPEGLRIELRPRGLAKAAPLSNHPPVPQVKPEAPRKAEAVRPSSLVATAAPTAPAKKVVIPKPVVAPAVRAETHDAVKAEVQSTLPAASPRQAMASPLPSPASSTPEVLRAEHAAQTLTIGNEVLSAAQTPPPAGTPIGAPDQAKPVYTGEPISLNLKDVDLKDFFRLIHEISGLNIIIDPNVSGTVTMVLDSVPWDQALDIVLKNNGLGKVLEGNVLRIARVQTLTAEQDEQTKLAEARINAAPLVTLFRPINYAKATDIATLLKTWAGGGALSKRGTVLVDGRANTLIISDVQSRIPIIESIVNKLDKKAKQVSIEARVVLATANFNRTLAAALSGSTRTAAGSTQVGGMTGSTANVTPSNTTPNSTPPLSSLIMNQTESTGFGAFAITNASSRYLINAVITAQEERDQAKTLSRPHIVTQNNVQGMVQQGVQVPITTSINNTVTTQMYNATLELTVTPQVTDDGNIFLTINVNNGSLGAAVFGTNPSINTQQATTQVLVPDGGTVIFGGITVTSRTKAATYVPWLGSIPVLGHLFKSSNVTDQDQELLFFVSPKILPT